MFNNRLLLRKEQNTMKYLDVLKSGLILAMVASIWSCSGDDPQVGPTDEEIAAQLAVDIVKITDYISENNIQNVVSTSTGLHYVITEEGTGDIHEAGDLAVVHYEGRLLNDLVFDSTSDREPFTFQYGVGSVIPGFDQGIGNVRQEGKITLFIPSGLAYGPSGQGSIGANEVLIFDVELLSDNQIRDINIEEIELYVAVEEFEDVQSTASGLHYVITEEGEGDFLIEGFTISARYNGYLLDGTVFDRTTTSNFIYLFGEADLITGWDEAVTHLKKGSKGTFFLPSTIAYGRAGTQNGGTTIIRPNEVVVFDIEIVDAVN